LILLAKSCGVSQQACFCPSQEIQFLVSQASIAETGVVLPAFLMSPVKNRQELPTVSHTASEQRGLNFKSVEKMIAENADHFFWPLMISME
jgi:hypothetical protein